MPSLSALVTRYGAALTSAHVEWLHALVGDWQVLADVAMADLLLWLPDGSDWVTVAQCRPSTSRTVFVDDVVGTVVPERELPELVVAAYQRGALYRPQASVWDEATFGTGVLQPQVIVPVRCEDHVVAVLTQHYRPAQVTTPGRLELAYRLCADDVMSMVAAGDFPDRSAPSGYRRGAPRVGDGLVHLNAEGLVQFSSPNATSALRRLGYSGSLVGRHLSELVTPHVVGTVDEMLPLVLAGRSPWRSEITGWGGVVVSFRAIPIIIHQRRTGAMVLVRDISQLRRQEHELLSKDAAIREVHHRVKNNLQTVAALLHMQARRAESPAVVSALQVAMRRVDTIATVHELLSEGFAEQVDFDPVCDRVVRLAVDAARRESPLEVRRQGMCGLLRSSEATTIALAVNEVVTNAVQHGLPGGGTITVTAERTEKLLRVCVDDDGIGWEHPTSVGVDLGSGQFAGGLGMHIMHTLVVTNGGGNIQWQPSPQGGTRVAIELPLLG